MDYEAAAQMMDDDLREELHGELAPCTEQQFFRAYELAHAKRSERSGNSPRPTRPGKYSRPAQLSPPRRARDTALDDAAALRPDGRKGKTMAVFLILFLSILAAPFVVAVVDEVSYDAEKRNQKKK